MRDVLLMLFRGLSARGNSQIQEFQSSNDIIHLSLSNFLSLFNYLSTSLNESEFPVNIALTFTLS